MFKWFRPACPCDPVAKAWVEERLQWLSEQFEDSAFSGLPVVLPTNKFFPDRYDGSLPTVRKMLERVCRFMDLDADSIVLKLASRMGHDEIMVDGSGQQLPGLAGTYKRVGENFVITLNKADLERPMNLVGTLAHELAHVRLLGEFRIEPDVFDNELLTDLTAVFFGFGIFLANSPRAFQSQMSKWPGTQVKKPEYMSAPMYAHALAHLAWFRGERKPAWGKHLHFNARPEFKQALRYLLETGDSTFQPGAV